ncbi:hypothetical protein SCALM49S_08402 [Streptomyces californicus]
MGARLRVLPLPGADGGDDPGGLPRGLRHRDAAERPTLFSLPHIPTPDWYAGIQLGGPVSLEALLSAATDGLRLACMLCCIGAANTLANPKRALRVLPGALYDWASPSPCRSASPPNWCRACSGWPAPGGCGPEAGEGLRALRGIVVPVLEDALERSLRLAAAMDSRGYGRAGSATPRSRRLTGALMLLGMCGLCAGAYGLLDPSSPAPCWGCPRWRRVRCSAWAGCASAGGG